MASKNGETRQCANTNRVSIEKSHARKIDMKSLQKNELTFHNTTFAHMEIGGQVWLTASEVGEALGYADDKAIHRLYRKHADEFTSNMTGVVKVTTPGGMQDVRMFSLRGAHLMGMFSRTPVAKEFRRWVLDILDREASESPDASPMSRYYTKVVVRDTMFGADIEFIGKADSLNKLATGICKTLGYSPTGFTEVEIDAARIKKVH